MAGVWLAMYHTTHFSFHAIGKSRAAAIQAMEEALDRHRKHYPAAQPHFWDTNEFDLVQIPIGGALRDGEPL